MAQIPLERIRNIGISAHIDSGKTTLTERILFYTGRIHAIHEVRGKDGVGAKMDSMDLEREKGITIQSAATYCIWKGRRDSHNINIIDTPGHVDFTIEVERALRVLDGAILVLDSGKGVQSQSITVDQQMKRYRRAPHRLRQQDGQPGRQLRARGRHAEGKARPPPGQAAGADRRRGDRFAGIIDAIDQKAYYFDGENGENVREEPVPADYVEKAKAARAEMIQAVADVDDQLAEKFINDEPVTDDELRAAIRRATLALKMTPVMCGSAFRNKGVQLLLDAVNAYLPNPKEVEERGPRPDEQRSEDRPRVELRQALRRPRLQAAAGQVRPADLLPHLPGQDHRSGDTIINSPTSCARCGCRACSACTPTTAKRCRRPTPATSSPSTGSSASSGETFTDGKVNYTMTSMHVPAAVICLAVQPKDRAGEQNFSKALNRFTKEDPTFRVHQDEESGQTIISGMGELHLDIYMERMRREYNCEVIAGKPQVAYRETITQRGEFCYTHKKQTGGSGQFARVCGFVEPLPADAVEQYEFVDEIAGGAIPREFIPACDKGFKRGDQEGLADRLPRGGRALHHQRRPLARGRLVGAGVQDRRADGLSRGLRGGQADDSRADHEGRGRGADRVPGHGGGPDQPAPRRDRRHHVCQRLVMVNAEVPLNTMFGYSTDLRSGTQGKGNFTMEFAKYSPVPRLEQEEMIKKYKEKQAQEAASRK